MWGFKSIYHGALLRLNTLRPRQDGRHFTDDIFVCIFFNENCCVLIKFSLKYLRKGPINNNPALVEIMAWCRSGNKPLSEPMVISLPTHICVTRPQWVNAYQHYYVRIFEPISLCALFPPLFTKYIHWCDYLVYFVSLGLFREPWSRWSSNVISSLWLWPIHRISF